MKTLQHINPMGTADVPVLGRQKEPFGEHGSGQLEAGEIFKTTDEIAGCAPYWRPSEEGDADADGVIRRFETRVDDDLLEVLDLGSGLLAQVDSYREVAAGSDGLDKKTKDELTAHAAAQTPPIDLTGTTTKAEILAAIRKA